jgi:hypothetical protein
MIKNKRTEGKITAHYGVKDYFNYFTNNFKELNITRKTYHDVLKDFNEGIIDLIIENNIEYNFPHIGSSLIIKKTKKTLKIVDGKLLNTTPVDWVATNKLWSEDNESLDKKLLVRYSNYHTSKHVFRIYFKKYVYPFKNKKYFKFKANRTFSRLLGKRIKDENKDKYDAFLLY